MNNEKRFHVFSGVKNELPALITYDPEYKIFQNKEYFSWLLWIRIELKGILKNGQPDNEEESILNHFEDVVIDKLEKTTSIFYVGRVTWHGERALYLYVANAEIANQVLRTLLNTATREFEYRIERDRAWEKPEQYFGISDQKKSK